ncbi:MAG: hypothetical protein E6R13_05985 [Spirochaetes bacterium]|nr:MAG: hypothetical protein E6R13_05985 [Spirochaetota bacterium]
MSKKKTKKIFDTFEQIAYKDWVGLGEFESYECTFCGNDIDFPKRKCPECGALHTFEKATLELIRPVQVKEGKIPPTPEYVIKWRKELEEEITKQSKAKESKLSIPNLSLYLIFLFLFGKGCVDGHRQENIPLLVVSSICLVTLTIVTVKWLIKWKKS